MRWLQACLNGARSARVHPALPCTPDALARDTAAVRAQGAFSVHVHPRDPSGRESLSADAIGSAVAAIRAAAPGLPIGVSTGEWIDPDLERLLAAIRSWDVRPDFASVNFSEPGALEVCRVLGESGVGIEVGLSSAQDAARFLAHRVPHVRILLEPGEPDGPSALANAQGMLRALDTAGITSERLLHGQEGAAWQVLAWAMRSSLRSRIGLEDVLVLPDGARAKDNAALFAAAWVHS